MTAPLTNYDSAQVRVWKSFTLYRGALATEAAALPTSLTSALDSTLVGMGNTDNTGIVENPGQTMFDTVNYSGQVILRTVSAGTYELGLSFEQTSKDLLEAWYANLAAAGSIIYDPLAETPHYTWVAQMFNGSGAARRIVVPDGQLIRNGNTTFSSKAESLFPFNLVGYPTPLLIADSDTGSQGIVQIWDSVLPTS